MTTIVGMSELLSDREPDDPAMRHSWYDMIHRESTRVAEIVADMLDVTRIQTGNVQVDITDVSLGETIEKVVAPLRESSTGHVFVVEIPEGLPRVKADQGKLAQVLVNLVDNAIKYSPSGGPVHVRVSVAPQGHRALVSIADKGIGITDEETSILFQPFGRVRNERTVNIRGTGLGLYITKNLVAMMGGDLHVESTSNLWFVAKQLAVSKLRLMTLAPLALP